MRFSNDLEATKPEMVETAWLGSGDNSAMLRQWRDVISILTWQKEQAGSGPLSKSIKLIQKTLLL